MSKSKDVSAKGKGGKINYERLIRETAELEHAVGNMLLQIDKNKRRYKSILTKLAQKR